MEARIKYTLIEEPDDTMQSFEERIDIVEVSENVELDVWLNEKYPAWVPGGDSEHDFTYGCYCPVVKDMDGHVILFRRDSKSE